MFNITMLPAAQGDCLWIEYGDEENPFRILIDCGTPPTYRGSLRAKIESLGERPYIDLLIVTHIDTDHIGGVLKLVDDPPKGLRFGQVWFNAWRHLEPDSLDLMGPVDGEILSRQLDQAGWKWNTSFRQRGHAAVVPSRGDLKTYRLPGGMKLTLLSPGVDQLLDLRETWEEVCAKGGLVPGVPSQRLREKAARKGIGLDFLGGDPVRELAETKTALDDTVANGSTIAVFAEYEDGGTTKKCVLAGDAHADVLGPSIRRLAGQRGEDRLALDAFKLPHHGSEHNVTRELLETVDCRHYLFSSSGTTFHHPHPIAVARAILDGGPNAVLHFNYRTTYNERWDDLRQMRKYGYSTEYGDGTLTVEL